MKRPNPEAVSLSLILKSTMEKNHFRALSTGYTEIRKFVFSENRRKDLIEKGLGKL